MEICQRLSELGQRCHTGDSVWKSSCVTGKRPQLDQTNSGCNQTTVAGFGNCQVQTVSVQPFKPGEKNWSKTSCDRFFVKTVCMILDSDYSRYNVLNHELKNEMKKKKTAYTVPDSTTCYAHFWDKPVCHPKRDSPWSALKESPQWKWNWMLLDQWFCDATHAWGLEVAQTILHWVDCGNWLWSLLHLKRVVHMGQK